jgi:hypothetical protein
MEAAGEPSLVRTLRRMTRESVLSVAETCTSAPCLLAPSHDLARPLLDDVRDLHFFIG